MKETLLLPEGDILPGKYVYEVDGPRRANGALFKVSRPAAPNAWPSGPVFSWKIYERDRGTGELQLLAQAEESGTGGDIVTLRFGVNPPLSIGVRWPEDADKDRIRVELAVVQQFRAAISLEWVR